MQELQLTTGSQKKNRRALDFYPTPPEVTIALMDFLKLEPCTIWECASGEGDMASIMESYGHRVIATDIRDGFDYLSTNMDCDAVITNPPFNLSSEFIKKSLKDAPISAFLLKSQYWHAKKRYDLFIEHKPAFVLPLTWRPDFKFKQHKAEGKKSSPTMEVYWTVYIKGEHQCRYIPLKKPINKFL